MVPGTSGWQAQGHREGAVTTGLVYCSSCGYLESVCLFNHQRFQCSWTLSFIK